MRECYTDATVGTNNNRELAARLPTLTRIVGTKNLNSTCLELAKKGKDWAALFCQAESDLIYLSRHKRLSDGTLRRAYRRQLNAGQFVESMYEIYTASLVASVSDEIQLHVPTKGQSNSDFRITIRGYNIYGEVKTRHDTFPFNASPIKDASGEDLYISSRATVDFHVAERPPHPEIDKFTPESTEIRQRIEEALGQLPEASPNLIVIGFISDYDSPHKIKKELEDALTGDSYYVNKSYGPMLSRHPNGIFSDGRYGKSITSVAWLALKRSSRGMVRRSGIFFNPNSACTLPNEVELVLEQLFDRETVLKKELERIVEKLKSDYNPEKIILFGSLSQGKVKEASDIDLAIIKETDKRPLDRSLEVARIAQPILGVNFLVYTPREFQREQEANNFFVVDEILKRGRVLYER
jgi:predicted nucleotidyltransferase